MVYSRMLHKNFKTQASRRKGEIAVANWRKARKLHNFVDTNKTQLDKDYKKQKFYNQDTGKYYNSFRASKNATDNYMKKKYGSKPSYLTDAQKKEIRDNRNDEYNS